MIVTRSEILWSAFSGKPSPLPRSLALDVSRKSPIRRRKDPWVFLQQTPGDVRCLCYDQSEFLATPFVLLVWFASSLYGKK